MSFKKMEKPTTPPRHWVLVGYPGSGKSTFATQMKTPLLPIDADHRFEEVVHLAQGDVYELSSNPADSANPETIARLLNANMPGSKVETIVVDSLTTIIAPKVVEAMFEADARRERNKTKKQGERKENLSEPFKDKALAMRLLQDSVTRWGTDTLWIYHLQDGRDEQAREVTTATLSKTERARLYRSINLELHVVSEAPSARPQAEEKNRRGIKVVWARRGRSGITLWDDTGKWAGMPEKIEQAVYAGLTPADQEKIEKEAPAAGFPTEEAAIEWGMGQGVFKDFHHSQNAFNKLKENNPDLSLADLSGLWVDDIKYRKEQPGQPVDDTPGFHDLKEMLTRFEKDFGKTESESKALLKDLGFSGFPRNGEAFEKSKAMYRAVKAEIARRAEAAPITEEEIAF